MQFYSLMKLNHVHHVQSLWLAVMVFCTPPIIFTYDWGEPALSYK